MIGYVCDSVLLSSCLKNLWTLLISACMTPMIGPIKPMTQSQISSSKSGRYMANMILSVSKATMKTITKCFI